METEYVTCPNCAQPVRWMKLYEAETELMVHIGLLVLILLVPITGYVLLPASWDKAVLATGFFAIGLASAWLGELFFGR